MAACGRWWEPLSRLRLGRRRTGGTLGGSAIANATALDGPTLYQAILNVSFEGATGDVSFSRDAAYEGDRRRFALPEGAKVRVVEKDESGWWYGTLVGGAVWRGRVGETGRFPSQYVRELR